jgi:UDP:flavonoid glycosyltransferase YjiC (YdhE family)
MKTVLFVWELGANLGHLARLEPMVLAFETKGWRICFATRQPGQTAKWIGERRWQNFSVPVIEHSRAQVAPTCHADWLLPELSQDNAALSVWLGQWRQLMGAACADAVVLDFAPMAAIAMQCLGIHYTISSTGFCLPLGLEQGACFRPWDFAAIDRARQTTRQLFDRFVQLNRLFGLRENALAIQSNDPTRVQLATFFELDHFAGRSANLPYMGAIWSDAKQSPPAWRDSPKINGKALTTRVFCYLNGPQAFVTPIVRALSFFNADFIAYVPNLSGIDKEELIREHSWQFCDQPVALTGLLVSATWVVSHGGLGLAARALVSNTKLMVFPFHSEQMLLASALKRYQLCSTSLSSDISAICLRIQTAFDMPELTVSTLAFSSKYAGFTPTNAANAMVDSIIAQRG